MTLIGILFALLIERVLSHARQWREQAAYSRYVAWLGEQSWARWAWETSWGLLLLVVTPVLLVALLQAGLDGGVLELLAFVFSVIVLILCLGPRDLGEEVHAYIRAVQNGDKKEMAEIAADLGTVPPATKKPDSRSLVTAVMIQGHERLLAVLFWFYLLGPVGAVLYRLAANLPRHLESRDCSTELHEVSRRLHGLLAWLPARAVCGLYMLAGSTDDALANWKSSNDEPQEDWAEQTWHLLATVGCGALMVNGAKGPEDEVQVEKRLTAALGLVRRSLLLALGVLAAFTLGGWVI